MRRLSGFILAALLLSAATTSAQNTRIISGSSVPATCTAGGIFLKTGGGSEGFYICLTANTWTGPLVTTDTGITQLTGNVTAGPGSGSQAATIANDAVTYAKLQDISATSRGLCRKTAGAGDTEECTLSEILDFIGSAAQGDVLYRGAATWARLGAGTAGQCLTTGGAGANPSWGTCGSGGGTEFELLLMPTSNEPPTSNPATPDLRNIRPVLDFDAATDESAIFTRVLPAGYGGGGLTLDTYWACTSATSGAVRVQAAIERNDASSLDIDADSFATANSAGGTCPGTSGQIIKITITFTSGAQMDSLAAGEVFRVKINRDADGTSGTDDATGDAEYVAGVIKET